LLSDSFGGHCASELKSSVEVEAVRKIKAVLSAILKQFDDLIE